MSDVLCLTWQATDVHLFQILGFQDDDCQFTGSGHVSQRETDVAQFVLLQTNRVRLAGCWNEESVVWTPPVICKFTRRNHRLYNIATIGTVDALQQKYKHHNKIRTMRKILDKEIDMEILGRLGCYG